LNILDANQVRIYNCSEKGTTYMGFLLPDHDGRFQMNVYNDQKFLVTRLEEKVLDVSEQNI
jgi:hypothetical protein